MRLCPRRMAAATAPAAGRVRPAPTARSERRNRQSAVRRGLMHPEAMQQGLPSVAMSVQHVRMTGARGTPAVSSVAMIDAITDGVTIVVAGAARDRTSGEGVRAIPVVAAALTVRRTEVGPGTVRGARVVPLVLSVGARLQVPREIVAGTIGVAHPGTIGVLHLGLSAAGNNAMTEPPVGTASRGGHGRGIDPHRRSGRPATRGLSLRYRRTSLARNWTGPCGARCAP